MVSNICVNVGMALMGKNSSILIIIDKFDLYVSVLQAKNILILYWGKPLPGRLKLSCDGASKSRARSASGGSILHDSYVR